MNSERRARWAISFADLALLLLGFFVLLQASGNKSAAVLEGVGAQFGGQAQAKRADGESWEATGLFQAQEAMLTPVGKARISAFAARHAAGSETIELNSAGQDKAARRFDAWDLAAARLGAVARAMEAGGIAPARLAIRGLDQQATDKPGQVIRVAVAPAKAP